MVWYSCLFNFPVCCDLQSKTLFSVVNNAKVDFFLEFPCFFYDPTDVGNLVSGSFDLSKPSLKIEVLSSLLKPSLKDFKHNLAGM